MSALTGLPVEATGRIATSAGPAASFNRGMGFDAAGALVVANAPGAVPRNFNGSVNVTNAGAVCVDSAGAVATHVSGLPLTAAGDLAVTFGAPTSFSQGVGFIGERVAVQ